MTALLRLPWGATMTEKIPVDVPESVTDKMLSLVVGGGASINALEFRFSALGGTPRDSQQLVHALNRMRRNNRVYALLMAPQRSFVMQGDEYPSPPPSLVQTFMADPAAASSVMFSGTSVVGDFETKPTPVRHPWPEDADPQGGGLGNVKNSRQKAVSRRQKALGSRQRAERQSRARSPVK